MKVDTLYINEYNHVLNKQLISLSKECKIQNKNYFYIDRTPNYFKSKEVFDGFTIVAIRDSANDKIVASGICIEDKYNINGQTENVMYVTDVGIHPNYRKSLLFYKFMEAVYNHFSSSSCKYLFAITGKYNNDINKCLAQRKSNLFSWKIISSIYFHHFIPIVRYIPIINNKNIFPVKSEKELIDVINYFNSYYSNYSCYRVVSLDRVKIEMKKLKDFSYENFVIIKEDNKIVGALCYYDPSEIAKIIITSYATIFPYLSNIINFINKLFFLIPNIPNEGEALKTLYIRYIAFENKYLYTKLLNYVINIGIQKNFHTICLLSQSYNMPKNLISLIDIKDENYLWFTTKPEYDDILNRLKNNLIHFDTSLLM